MCSKVNLLINSEEVGADLDKCLQNCPTVQILSPDEMQSAYWALCASRQSAVILPGPLPRRKAGIYCSLALMHVKGYCAGLVEVMPYMASNKPTATFLTAAQVKERLPVLYRRWEAASTLLNRPDPLTNPTPAHGPAIVSVTLI
jgi:hypothetical protein